MDFGPTSTDLTCLWKPECWLCCGLMSEGRCSPHTSFISLMSSNVNLPFSFHWPSPFPIAIILDTVYNNISFPASDLPQLLLLVLAASSHALLNTCPAFTSCEVILCV